LPLTVEPAARSGAERPSEASPSSLSRRFALLLKELSASPTSVAFVVCGVVALAAVWLHRYPLGVDLPQHANLFRLWADLAHGPFEYRATYHIEFFTPYLLPYAVALPLTKLFGALIATKLLLSFMVIATPACDESLATSNRCRSGVWSARFRRGFRLLVYLGFHILRGGNTLDVCVSSIVRSAGCQARL